MASRCLLANLKTIKNRASIAITTVRSMSSDWGSGAGKGGGGGGSIREAGGSFGKMESAHEEQYFRKKQAEQLEDMKKHLHEEIARHKSLIKEHEEAIEKSKKRIEEMGKKNK